MRVLLVDENPQDRERVVQRLSGSFENVVVTAADSVGAYRQALDGSPPDLVLTEHDLRWTDGLTVLREVRDRWPGVPVIMVTGTETGARTARLVVRGFRAGLQDYVTKDALGDLAPAVRRSLAQPPAVGRSGNRPPQSATTQAQFQNLVERLAGSEAYLDTLLDAVPVGVCLADARGAIVRTNAAFLELWGLPPETRCWEDYAHWVGYRPETGERIQAHEWAMARAVNQGETTVGELIECERFGTGEHRFYLNNVAPVHDVQGERIGAVGVALDVTAQRRAERELRESEALYRAIARHFPDGVIFVFDHDLRFRVAEGQALTALGYASEQLEGKTIREAFHSEILPFLEERYPRVLAGEAFHVETPIRGRVFSSDYVPIRDDEGRVTAGMVVSRDVTERQQVAAALEESRRQLAAELDAAHRLHAFSTQLVRVEGLPGLYEQVLDAAVAVVHADFASLQRFHPDRGAAGELQLLGHRGFTAEAAEFWAWVTPTSYSTCGIALRTRERVIAPDVEQCEAIAGSDDHAVFSATGIRAVQTTPLLSRSGELLGMLSTHWRTPHTPTAGELRTLDILARLAADLIERREARAKLRASEERYRTLFASIDEGYCVVEVLFDAADHPVDYRFLEVNPAFTAQTGIEDAVGRCMREIAPDHEEHWFEIYGWVAQTGEPVRFENRAQALGGRFYEGYAFRLDPPEKRQVGILFRDVSKRKQTDEALRHYADELETLVQTNEALLREVNHRVKNTLSSILSLIYAEKRRPIWAPSPEVGEALDDLAQRVRDLSTVHTLLSAGGWKPLRLDELVGEVVQTATATARSPEALIIDVRPSPVRVTPNQAHHLALVIGELVTNTVKYGTHDRAPRITVTTTRQGDDVCLTYADSGPGFPPEVLDGSGRSVGLKLVNTLVTHSLRGTWTVRNAEGAVVEICFPVDGELNGGDGSEGSA